jgi:hypothetical protein
MKVDGKKCIAFYGEIEILNFILLIVLYLLILDTLPETLFEFLLWLPDYRQRLLKCTHKN